MLSEQWIAYLNHHILLKDERLDLLSLQENGHLIDIHVVRRTKRTRRVVGKLTVGCQVGGEPPNELVQIFYSPYTKRKLLDTEEFFRWLQQGWVIREYRFEKDERTVKTERARMGLTLYQYQQEIQEKEQATQKQRLRDWLVKWEKVPCLTTENDTVCAEALSIFKEQMEKVVEEVTYYLNGEVKNLTFPVKSWQLDKRFSYIEFLLALYKLALTEGYFDWKQIGATYYQTIGGSKRFDRYKDEFLQQTEKLLNIPLHIIGLGSFGTVTPILFSGSMLGTHANYDLHDVHAVTDAAVFSDDFRTDARILWLVENRGVLTRMAYEKNFLEESQSFVLSLDGQLRSGHARLISQLAPSVEQVIIWTDVDEAGLIIANDVYRTVYPVCEYIKWIVPPLQVVTTLEAFNEHYQKAIDIKKLEQEQELGGVEKWKKWIYH